MESTFEVASMSLPGHTQCGVHLEGGLHKAINSRESHTVMGDYNVLSALSQNKVHGDFDAIFAPDTRAQISGPLSHRRVGYGGLNGRA